jgi:hypothetical protein
VALEGGGIAGTGHHAAQAVAQHRLVRSARSALRQKVASLELGLGSKRANP